MKSLPGFGKPKGGIPGMKRTGSVPGVSTGKRNVFGRNAGKSPYKGGASALKRLTGKPSYM